MLYLYIIILVVFVVGLTCIYLLRDKNMDKDTENFMEDVPTISINKEKLESYATEISQYYSETKTVNSKRRIMRSLDASHKNIIKGYEYIDKETRVKREVVPAAEWLLDNIYLIEKEYKNIRYNMPEAYYKKLPVISKGMMKGFPRIYHIAVELVSHTDGAIDESTIEMFINAYQKNALLTSGELWALPIFLRIALIQNISKVTDKIVYSLKEKKKGDIVAEKIIAANENNNLENEIKNMSLENIVFSSHFTERLLKVLRDSGIDTKDIYKWIDNELEVYESSVEKKIAIEHQKQANFQLSMGNCVSSVRAVEALNWKDCFERLSYVEKILREDPAKIYNLMDFESRDYYRHMVEDISKNIKIPEYFIAKKAVECAKENIDNNEEKYRKHVGYYIVDDGIECLKKKIGAKSKYSDKISLATKKHKSGQYIATIVVCTLLLDALLLISVYSKDNFFAWWKYLIGAIVVLVPCSEIVISILNWSINRLTKPSFIPKLEFMDGIPSEYKTMVVVPTLLNSEERVTELVGELEIYYIANASKNIFYALLGDFKDSDKEVDETDEAINNRAIAEIQRLNKKYAGGGNEIFYYLNRVRQFNSKQNVWLGWERKRGKLMEFNQLLRGNKNTSYNVISGDISSIRNIKYIITLDADTKLPMGSAKKLVGAMAHVLNRPVINEKCKKVVRGYGLMQPRVSVGNVCAHKTMFSKIFSGETGIDTYTTAVSDVYQDIFGEGSFTGKGIYDIDVFNYMLDGEIPENTVLSHDLLEGSYVRTALLTDVELIDGYPAYYNSSAMRLHRWVRGDWQLIPWLTKKSPLNTLSKWKIFDNLRRSLVSVSIIFLIIIALLILPSRQTYLTLAFVSLLCPMLFDVSETVTSPIKGVSLSGKVSSGKMIAEQVFLVFCFLPYSAYLMVDAIVRTIYRMKVSEKNLLEWQTAADVEHKLGKELKDFMASMAMGSILAIFILLISLNSSLDIILFMLPSCIVWFISPYVAYSISKEIKHDKAEINKEDIKDLRRLTRKTWCYFEDFVNEENNYLAPDNYQENPANGLAHRTSPTNIAMGLTSNLVAYDMGYIGILELVERINKTVESMESLDKLKGHLYNWYDTRTKEPLHPIYISTVDSGNLVGYLWVVSKSLEDYCHKDVINPKVTEGLVELLQLCNEEIYEVAKIQDLYSEIVFQLKNKELNIMDYKLILIAIKHRQQEVEKIEGCHDLYWNNKIKHSVEKLLEEYNMFFSWSESVFTEHDMAEEVKERLLDIGRGTNLLNINKKVEKVIRYLEEVKIENSREWILELKSSLGHCKYAVEQLLYRIDALIKRIDAMAENTDFKLVYDEKRQLFSIGYDMDNDVMSKSYYDLLASEARQASFVAIAKGDVDVNHWFKLGRSMTIMNRSKGLVSWSGTMFEYFMPLLIMKSYPDTLLCSTYQAVVDAQKKYATQRKLNCWGISESAFYTFDTALNYQYKAFGVPGVGLKRGLSNEIVISPYSTVLALQADVHGAMRNIRMLVQEGMEGKYGLYESIDYTKDRMPKGMKHAIVKCFMVHHEGMSLMALDNILNNNILQDRFHSIPCVKATELLLQEKIPKRVVYDREHVFEAIDICAQKQYDVIRNYNTAKSVMPQTHLLSNGSYSMMISNSGSGYGKKGDTTAYRWREDVTRDSSGMFFYIKNINSNEYWSAAYEPCKDEGEEYQVIFSLDKAEFKRKDGSLTTHTEITVSNEDDAELRKISIINHSEYERVVEVTSYLEATLSSYSSDLVHPSFGNLFIQTEYVEETGSILCSRRPRAKGQKQPWEIMTIAVEGEEIGALQYETSRLNFIGRGRDLQNPKVMENDASLTNTVGAVLDPVISMRKRIRIRPGATCRIAYTLAVTNSREEALELGVKYSEMQNVSRAFDLAFNQSSVEMQYLGIKSPQANLYQLMAANILFLSPERRKKQENIESISVGQSSLWAYGISGDLPIALTIVREDKDIDMVRQMLNAHEYWSVKGLKVDLVILNMQNSAYLEPLQDAIRDLVASGYARDKQNKPGGVFVHRKGGMEEEVINLLIAMSRLVIDGEKGSIIHQIGCTEMDAIEVEDLVVKQQNYESKPHKFETNKLEFFNDLGGFDVANDKYVILLKNHRDTPAPWINVMSNGNFGFHVSEGGISYTWFKNSRENKLTTWSNDPIIDGEAEQIYLRDEVDGELWSISPKPIRDGGEYIIEHSFGYSTFKHEAKGIVGEMTMFMPIHDDVKLCIVKLKNNSSIKRKIGVTYYGQLVLGVTPQGSSQYVYSSVEEEETILYAQNSYHKPFDKQQVYLKIFGGLTGEYSYSGSRTEFIGRGGNIHKPRALTKNRLSNMVGAGLDPCLSAMSKIELLPDEEVEVVIMLGACEEFETMKSVVRKYSNINNVKIALKATIDYWRELLHTIQVKTPDETMNIMINGWLMYQTIACRLWARTAFYQSGGAYGFRDQLQDVMAISYLNPEITRRQILYSASRQFVEGDVQHWWHPIVDSGIRTRFSDDLLWLPYVTYDYIKNTGDYAILDEEIYYLEDRPLEEGEDERYTISRKSEIKGSLYEHCIKTIERSLKFGAHNIPLMGCGDWNDGMSTIGNKGKGESVWVGWFLYKILSDFIGLCKYRKDDKMVDKYETIKMFIQENLEKNAWDGGWYRRAYFDDGTPLGSVENDECRIDSLSQSWAVISGAAKASRIEEAMEALERNLVKEENGMVLLLTPAFYKSKLEPGYIKGYVPGVRENGGQYTHASTWVAMAMAKLGHGDKAWKIYNMINPINHSKSKYQTEKYKVEPYVMTADVYGVEPHIGRGGWSWYTGAAGWMYRIGIESLLGLKFVGEKGFTIEPCVPKDWHEYSMEYRRNGCKYVIDIKRGKDKKITLDDKILEDNIIPYLEEGTHKIQVIF